MNNYRYITTPKNSINELEFFTDTAIIKERSACGSGYWPGKWGQHSTIFTEEFKLWLLQFNCKILKAEAFRVFPHTALAWHNDTNEDPNADDLTLNFTAKINFMWGDLQNCFMEYGELSNSKTSDRKIFTNQRGRRAYVYDPAAMKIVERFSLENTVLINRGPTHRVSNESDKDWLCLSCIIIDNDTDKPLLYSKGIDLFKSSTIL
jgi:hypothetical protein